MAQMQPTSLETLEQTIIDTLDDTLMGIQDVDADKRDDTLKATAALLDSYVKLVNSKNDHKLNLEKLALEQYKVEYNLKVEKVKSGISPGRICVELAKAGVPLMTTLMTIKAHREEFDIAGKFEETGRYVSQIMRWTGLFPVKK